MFIVFDNFSSQYLRLFGPLEYGHFVNKYQKICTPRFESVTTTLLHMYVSTAAKSHKEYPIFLKRGRPQKQTIKSLYNPAPHVLPEILNHRIDGIFLMQKGLKFDDPLHCTPNFPFRVLDLS